MYYDRSRHIQSPPAAYRPKNELRAVYGFRVSRFRWIGYLKTKLSFIKTHVVWLFSIFFKYFSKNNIFEHKSAIIVAWVFFNRNMTLVLTVHVDVQTRYVLLAITLVQCDVRTRRRWFDLFFLFSRKYYVTYFDNGNLQPDLVSLRTVLACKRSCFCVGETRIRHTRSVTLCVAFILGQKIPSGFETRQSYF